MDYLNNPEFQVEFNESYLKPDKITFAPNKMINFYIPLKQSHHHLILTMILR